MKALKAFRAYLARNVNWLLAALMVMVLIKPDVTIKNSRVVITLGTAEAYAAGTADYSLGTDGAANAVTVQTALNALPNQGGLLHFKAGTYNLTANVTRAIGNITIEGEGIGTKFIRNGSAAIWVAGGNNWVFRDMAVDSNSTINMGATTDWSWVNVYDQETLWNSRVQSGQVVFVTANGTALFVTSLNGTTLNATQLTATTGNISTLNAPTGGGNTYIVAASDAPTRIKNQADANVTGDASTVLQASLDAANTSGYGYIRWVGNFTFSTGLVLNPSNLKAPLLIDTYAANLTYNGSGIAINITTNELVPGAVNADKAVTWLGLTLYGTSSALGGLVCQDNGKIDIGNPYISGFTKTNAFGIEFLSYGTGYIQEQSTIHDGTITNCYNPILLNNNAKNRMDETVISNMRLGVTLNGTGFKLETGSFGLQASTFNNIYVVLSGNNTIGFDFGNHQWIGSTFINPTVENPSALGNCTAFTSQGFDNPQLINPGVVNTFTTIWGGTSRNWNVNYRSVNDVFTNIPSLYGATLLYTMKDGAASKLTDVAGNGYTGTLISSPAWGTQGQLGKVTLASPQRGTTANLSLDGDRTFVIVWRPDFAYDSFSGTEKYFFSWTVDANNNISIASFGDNQTSLLAEGNAQSIDARAAATWSANQTIVIIATINSVTGNGTVYFNGTQIATNTNAAYSQSTATNATSLWGYAGGAGSQIPTGDWLFSAILPRVIPPSEALTLSQTFLNMAGVGY